MKNQPKDYSWVFIAIMAAVAILYLISFGTNHNMKKTKMDDRIEIVSHSSQMQMENDRGSSKYCVIKDHPRNDCVAYTFNVEVNSVTGESEIIFIQDSSKSPYENPRVYLTNNQRKQLIKFLKQTER